MYHLLTCPTGEMEGTMFTRFCRMQNLRILFTERNLPLEAHPIIEAFERRYKINVKGTILHDGSTSTSAVTVKGGKTEQAAEVGKRLAEAAKQAGIDTIVFDRGGYLFHGRVKALADGAREGGLRF